MQLTHNVSTCSMCFLLYDVALVTVTYTPHHDVTCIRVVYPGTPTFYKLRVVVYYKNYVQQYVHYIHIRVRLGRSTFPTKHMCVGMQILQQKI